MAASVWVPALVAALLAMLPYASAVPVYNCTGDEFIADDVDLCVYYQCWNGQPTVNWPTACAKGTRLPSYYNRSNTNPCIELVKNSFCLRCDVSDTQRKPDTISSLCHDLEPCDAGCLCHDEVDGYWCACPAQTTPPPITYASVAQCKVNTCLNNGTCYKLYDATPFCNCPPSFTGPRCEFKLCDWNPCEHNGKCIVNGTSIHCECDKCYKGSCCEILRREDPDCIGCAPCAGGADCMGGRPWNCTCNPCPSEAFICANAPLGGVRECNRGAATAASRFTLMFEENFYRFESTSNTSSLELYITAGADDGNSRTVHIYNPLGSGNCVYSNTTTIAAGEVIKFKLPMCLRHNGTGIGTYGISVTEVNNDTVTVYGINRASQSADSWLCLPDTHAGTMFVTLGYPTFNNQNGTDHLSQLGIVATENNTQVNITISCQTDVPNSKQDTTLIVNLNAYQTYQLQTSFYGADLSGTIITASKPIHVVSGNIRTSVIIDRQPSGTLSTDHLIEEIPTADTWGLTFAIVPMPRTVLGYTVTKELIRIVASFDTNCTLYNSTGQVFFSISTLIDYYKEFSVDAADNYFLECNSPILLMDITESSDERLPASNPLRFQNDPAMMYVPAVVQYTNYYKFAPPVYSQTNGPYGTTLTILAAKATEYQAITVNGVLTIAMPQFKSWSQINVPLPGGIEDDNHPNLFGAVINIPNNVTSTIRHPVLQTKFMCIIYAYDDRESIGHAGGSALTYSNDHTGGGLSQFVYAQGLPVQFIN